MSKDASQESLKDYLIKQMIANHGGRGQAMHGGSSMLGLTQGKDQGERDALAAGVAEQISKAFEGDAAALPRDVVWNYLDSELKKFQARDSFADSVGFEGAAAMSAGGGDADTAKLEGFAEKVAGSARLYDDLYKSMTEGLSDGDAMYIEPSKGTEINGYRNPLAEKVATEIVKQFDDPSKLTKAERKEVVAQLKNRINGIQKDSGEEKRQDFAKEFGWEENHSRWRPGYQKTTVPDAEQAQSFANAIASPVKAEVVKRQREEEAKRALEKQEKEQASRLEHERKDQEVKELKQNQASTKLAEALRTRALEADSKRVVAEKRAEAAAKTIQALARRVAAKNVAQAKLVKQKEGIAEAEKQWRAETEAQICDSFQIPTNVADRTESEQKVLESSISYFGAVRAEKRTALEMDTLEKRKKPIARELRDQNAQQNKDLATAQQKFETLFAGLEQERAEQMAAKQAEDRGLLEHAEKAPRSALEEEQAASHAKMWEAAEASRVAAEKATKQRVEEQERLQREAQAAQTKAAPTISATLEGTALEAQSQKIVAEKRAALALKEEEQKQGEEAAKKAVSDSKEKLYTKLYESMTKGDLSKRDQPMHGGRATLPFGKGSHEDSHRNPLAHAIAKSVAERYDGQLLSETDIDGINKGVSLKLSEFGSRKDAAEAYGWKEVHDAGRQKELEASGSDKHHEALEETKRDNFVSEVRLMSEPLYQTVYADVLKVTSEGQAEDQAKAEARRVAMDITMGLDKAAITPERQSAVLETLGNRLENYRGSAKVLGGQVLDDLGHSPQFLDTELAEEAKRADQVKARAQEAQKREFEEQKQREAEASATIGKAMQGMRARMELGQERVAEQQRKREEKDRLEAEELQAFIKRTRDTAYEGTRISSRPGTKAEEAYVDAFVKKIIAQRNYDAAKDGADQYIKTNTPVPQSLQERLATLQDELNMAEDNSAKAYSGISAERSQRRREVGAVIREEAKGRNDHLREHAAETGDMFAEFQRVTKVLEDEKKKLNRPWLRSLNHPLWFQQQPNSHNNKWVLCHLKRQQHQYNNKMI